MSAQRRTGESPPRCWVRTIRTRSAARIRTCSPQPSRPRYRTTMPRRFPELLLIALVAWAPSLVAGEFTINPLRVNLDRATRSSEITVRNDDTAPLRMQVQAMSWRQDAEGKDQYEVSDDLIYFPRALEILPGESRIIRVGVKAAPVSREETYRLFIEELPPAA